MKVLLLDRAQDFDLEASPVAAEDDLVHDLGLAPVFDAMSQGDKHLRSVARKVVLRSIVDPEAIAYRQGVLGDCIASDTAIRDMYGLCLETIAIERKHYLGSLARYPSSMLNRSVELLEALTSKLRDLRGLAEDHETDFKSDGLRRLCGMLKEELGDDYLAEVQRHLKTLRFRHGVTMSAEVGGGGKGVTFVLRRPHATGSWFSQILSTGPETYTYRIPDRDESGARALSELQDRGINLVANAVTQSTEHVVGFFRVLGDELAFYVGCLNLHHELATLGSVPTFPTTTALGSLRLSASNLIDVGLLLSLKRDVVGNDVVGNGKRLIVVTGANRGGKSTFLRSLGLAQIMAQCGMFVGADRLEIGVVRNVFTHFKRGEDVSMESGKFDEELVRMSRLIDEVRPNALVLFNESFASTNEREGSAVAREIVDALLLADVNVCFVTHQYELSHGLFEEERQDGLFLRAEREETGTRSFKLRQGEPLPTSFGEDLYERIFGGSNTHVAPAASQPRAEAEAT